MGLLEQSQRSYYEDFSDYGNYQFTSLEDIINYFMVVYVGEGKTISKINRTDVAFHAQRAMQELSFDTFKSIKSQEIELPPSLTMILPHDYVNYTKLSWSDSAGIKHPLYPTKDTSNPFKIKQENNGGYDFTISVDSVFLNGDFSELIKETGSEVETAWKRANDAGKVYSSTPTKHVVRVNNGRLEFQHPVQNISGGFTGRLKACWQEINVENIDTIHLSAKALSSAAVTGKTAGIVRIGFSTRIDLTAQTSSANADGYNPNAGGGNDLLTTFKRSKNMDADIYDVTSASGASFIEFSSGSGTMSAATSLEEIDVTHLDTVYVLIVSSGGTFNSSATYSPTSDPDLNAPNTEGINAVDDIEINFEGEGSKLIYHPNSTTWDKYKSQTPNENVNPEIHSYDTDMYDLNIGERYGLNPQHAQANGSFYIDNLRGLINFSSNVSGKTVILDYISDSLGTDGEMQVHKFAEEAMYKWIMYAVLSTRANTPEYIVRRYQKEKFAATRTAKLRLSNIKLEELTQILRGKSKHIKH